MARRTPNRPRMKPHSRPLPRCSRAAAGSSEPETDGDRTAGLARADPRGASKPPEMTGLLKTRHQTRLQRPGPGAAHIQAILSTLDFKSGPRRPGGLYGYEQQQLIWNKVDRPLAQPYAAFSGGELITLAIEGLIAEVSWRRAPQQHQRCRARERRAGGQRRSVPRRSATTAAAGPTPAAVCRSARSTRSAGSLNGRAAPSSDRSFRQRLSDPVSASPSPRRPEPERRARLTLKPSLDIGPRPAALLALHPDKRINAQPQSSIT